jgi:hypothetical protein
VCSLTFARCACTLTVMSLFDAVHVTPPGPCSRCGEPVPKTSLFCPECGQSMLRPKPTPDAVPHDSKDPEPPPLPASEPELEPNTTTGWLRRSLNLGKKPTGPVPPAEPAPALAETQQMSLFEIEQAKEVAKKKPQRTSPPVRFVLAFEDGSHITVGERPGVMGVKPLVEGEEGYRIFLEDETDTVAPEHCEFGVEKGVFWVQDLKTVNGTVVSEPGAPPLQCIPYEKYFVVRGSTVSLGGLSFTLN